MPAYAGFQLALELSNVLPIKDLAASAFTTLLNMARDLRNSGSDIVVEADLANIFGRGQVSLELERAFKAKVHITKIIPLHEGSEIELRTGPGPTLTRAFQNPQYFATVVTLSALCYFTPREDLAKMIAGAMAKRCEANVPGATSPSGYEGIENTLAACSTQCGEFHWAPYRAEIERRLRISMREYSWSPDYTRLTPAVLLGAMDFFYIVKSLPADRIVTVSFQTGFIPLTIWAHYILGLTVVVTGLPGPDVVFGNADEPHVFIRWRPIDPSSREDPCWTGEADDEGPEICLHETDMTIILSSKPEEHDSDFLSTSERHPLSGYGTVFLQRSLNIDTIIQDDDDIYVEAASFIAGFAIVASQRMARELTFPLCEGDKIIEDTGQPIHLERWRIMASVKLIFAGIPIDPIVCENYATFLSEHPLSESTLPRTFDSFFARVPKHRPSFSPAERMIRLIETLTKYVLIFAHVFDLGKCGDMPIILTDDISTFSDLIREIRQGKDRPGLVRWSEVFYGVNTALVSTDIGDQSRKRGHALGVSLYSNFGWSVYLDTFGDRDPAAVRPELIHIRKGTPMNLKTGERKLQIRDGGGLSKLAKSYVYPIERGPTYTPRKFAKCNSRKDYYTSLSYEFQITLFVAFQSSPEWQACGGSPSFQEIMRYSQMLEDLWNTHLTPECSHRNQNEREQTKDIKLGPDAVAILSGGEELEDGITLPEKIIILLTAGDPYVRWHAIENSCVGTSYSGRNTMLRTNKCCESCALDYVASQKGKWYLIL